MEVRRHFVLHDVAWLKGRHDWPQLAAVAMIEASVESAGTVSQSRRYHLSSRPLDAAAFGAVVCGRWGMENALHWVLDVVFGDDQARVRSRFGHRSQTDGHQPPQSSPGSPFPQGASENGFLVNRLPPRPHSWKGMNVFKRFS